MGSTPPPVIIVEYDPAWPAMFESLRSILDETLAAVPNRIEHAGSTSVLQLAAKPIIDIIIVIPSMNVFSVAAGALAALGYSHVGDQDVPGREVFKRDPGGAMAIIHGGEPCAHHLYMCPEDSINLKKMLYFRDYLRTHPISRDEYGSLKKRLATEYGNNRIGYTEAKTEFVDNVLETMPV